MFFFVKHMSGSDQARYRVKVGNINDRIEHVREAIQTALGGPQVAPVKRTRLFFKGKQLENGLSLFQYSIAQGDTIQILVSPGQSDIPTTTLTKTASTTIKKSPFVGPAGRVFEVLIESPKRSKDAAVTTTTTTNAEMEIAKKDTTPLQATDPADEQDLCGLCIKNPDRKCKTCGCWECGGKEEEESTLACDECSNFFHMKCLDLPLSEVPEGDWFCDYCRNDPNETIHGGRVLDISKTKKAKMPSAKQTKKWGGGYACVGRSKTCTIVDPHHFGPIPGVEVGQSWRYRIHASEAGVHRPPVGGIAGSGAKGCQSLVLAGGYPEDVDNGETFLYTGAGGRDLKTGNKRTAEQSFDQELNKTNLAIAVGCDAKVNAKEGAVAGDWHKSQPVRVLRGAKAAKHSNYAPVEGVRYDGIYKLVRYWKEAGQSGFMIWRYEFRRDDPSPTPWSQEGKKFIKDHCITMYVPDDYEAPGSLEAKVKSKADKKQARVTSLPSSDDDEPLAKRHKGASGSRSTSTPPTSISPPVTMYIPTLEVVDLISKDTKNKRAWAAVWDANPRNLGQFLEAIAEREFQCPVCFDMVRWPVTTPCGHNVCKACLEGSVKSFGNACPSCRQPLAAALQFEDQGVDESKAAPTERSSTHLPETAPVVASTDASVIQSPSGRKRKVKQWDKVDMRINEKLVLVLKALIPSYGKD